MNYLRYITFGAHQGSILGRLFFLLYINDLFTHSNIIVLIMFADDANLFYSNKNMKTVSDKISKRNI